MDNNFKTLQFRSFLGANPNVRNNICFTPNYDFRIPNEDFNIEEQVVTYICGHCIVFKNLKNGSDRVESVGSRKMVGISCFNFFPEEKLLGVAFRTENYPFIVLFDITSSPLKKRIQVSQKDIGSEEYICIDKSIDGEYFIAQGGGDAYRLILWKFDGLKCRVKATLSTTTSEFDPVKRSTFCPDCRHICVSGNGVFKILKIDKDSNLEVIKDGLRPEVEKENILCHSWLDEHKLIVMNDVGNIFLIRDFIFVHKLKYSPDDQLRMNDIAPFRNNGFILGGETGVVQVYEYNNDDQETAFKRKKVLRIKKKDEIVQPSFTSDHHHHNQRQKQQQQQQQNKENGSNTNENEDDKQQPNNNEKQEEGKRISKRHTADGLDQRDNFNIAHMAYDERSGDLVAMTEVGEIFRVQLTKSQKDEFEEDEDEEGENGEKKTKHNSKKRGNNRTTTTEKNSSSTSTENLGKDNQIVQEEVDDLLMDLDFHPILNYHSGPVTGIDTCVKKPICVTSSLDGTICMLDYLTNTVVKTSFKSNCLSVSIHPTGFYLLVAFSDSLKFMKVLGDELREHKTFSIRNCSEVRFCKGGHLFACVYGTVINVYSTFSLKLQYALRGHNGRVKSLFWKEMDTEITSVDVNGTVAEFRVRTEKKITENSAAKTSFNSVVATSEAVYAAGSDRAIHVFLEGVPHENCNTGTHPPTALALGTKTHQLFVGLDDGSVCVYDTSQEELLDDYDDRYFVHGSSITKMALNYRENLLFTCAADGTMCIFDVIQLNQQGMSKNTRSKLIGMVNNNEKGGTGGLGGQKFGQFIQTDHFSGEILISKHDLEEKNATIEQLKQKYRNLQDDNDIERKRTNMEFVEKIKNQAAEFEKQLKDKEALRESLYNKLSNLNLKYSQDSKLKDDENHEEIERLEKIFHNRIEEKLREFEEMKKKKDALIVKRKELAVQKRLKHERQMNIMKERHQIEVTKLNKQVSEYKKQIQEEEERFEEMMKQTKEDHRELSQSIMDTYEKLLVQKRDDNLKLNGLNTIKENNERELQKKIKVLEQRYEDLRGLVKKEDEKLLKKINETKAVDAENKERERTIVEKEKTIFELKKQNQELEKHKFVLDYKINKLTEEIKPTKDEILKMRRVRARKGKELERAKSRNEKLRVKVKNLKRKIKEQRRDILIHRTKMREHKVYQSRFQSEIHEIIQHVQDPDKILRQSKSFYEKHFKGTKSSLRRIDPRVQQEAENQKTFLKNKIEKLKKQLQKTTQSAKKENMKVMKDNVMLISQISVLREETKNLKQQLRSEEDRLNLQKEQQQNASDQTEEEKRLVQAEQKRQYSELKREIEAGKIEIEKLRETIQDLNIEKRARSRPTSREQRPPLT